MSVNIHDDVVDRFMSWEWLWLWEWNVSDSMQTFVTIH